MSYQLMPGNQAPSACMQGPDSTPEAAGLLLQRNQALLGMMDLFARQVSLPELLVELGRRLPTVIDCELIIFAMHDVAKKAVGFTILRDKQEPSAQHLSSDSHDLDWTLNLQKPVVISELATDNYCPDLVKDLCGQGTHSVCILPLALATRHLGVILFASIHPSAYVQADLQLFQQVAELVTLSVDTILSRESWQEDKEKLELLVEISQALSSKLQLAEIFPEIWQGLRRVMSLEYASISILGKEREGLSLFLIHPPLDENTKNIFSSSAELIAATVVRECAAKCYNRSALEQLHSPLAQRLLDYGIQYACCFPLLTSRGIIGTLNLACKNETYCDDANSGLMKQIANYIAIALENASAYQEIAALKAKLAEEKLYLEDEIRTELQFEEIVGESSQIKRVLADVRTVACSDANVLILGETGTGKELVARALHKMSGRKENSFIKLNCAAIPTGLLESELFGHEKGAFTGAISQKVGRMELAHGGTLFLDEVGDIPLELQPKLLRVLQDQEFERLGSTRTIKVNVRLVAATNRDLASLVAAREFRSDLYYRLRVFPILLAPLRERRQDIPLLVRYFVQRLSRRMNKVIDSIPTTTMDVLTSWDWPGNIRELENFLERSVILSRGPTLTIPAAELRPLAEVVTRRDTSLETAEREHILRILRETGGVISGARGAAARLGLKRTTLQSKMQKLGISRQDYQS